MPHWLATANSDYSTGFSHLQGLCENFLKLFLGLFDVFRWNWGFGGLFGGCDGGGGRSRFSESPCWDAGLICLRRPAFCPQRQKVGKERCQEAFPPGPLAECAFRLCVDFSAVARGGSLQRPYAATGRNVELSRLRFSLPTLGSEMWGGGNLGRSGGGACNTPPTALWRPPPL